jgi:manganese transport protein
MRSDSELSVPMDPESPGWLERIGNWLRTGKRALGLFGPAFVISVGYMDPGNWATDLDGGSRFAYRLLWVLLVSNIMAILLQTLSAKLGIATGRDLAQLCRERYSRPVAYGLWATAELAMVATDLAEFMGSALGIHLLFGIPLLPATFITGLDVLLLLAIQRWGHRGLELAIIGLVSLVGWSYVVELFLAKPDLGAIAHGLFVPHLDTKSIYVAIGMLGATVMPHNIYLHSALVQSRVKADDPAHNRKLYKFAIADSFVALNAAFFVNAAILIMAAAVFNRNGMAVASIEEAHATLIPLLGPLAAIVFAVALLASGLSSSVTGTLAGQVVMEGFLDLRWKPWVRRVATRVITMFPAVVAIAMGVDPLKILVLSQVFLSFQLPFAIIPLIQFTRDKGLMGEYVNSRWINVAAGLVTAVVIGLNMYLIYGVFFQA